MTLRKILKEKGFEFDPENFKDDGGLVIQAVQEWLTEKRKEKAKAAKVWGVNAEHEQRTLEFLKGTELDELLKELEGNY